MTLTKNSCLNGFVVTDAAIGVFSDGVGNRILNCRLVRNWQCGIMALRGLPQIENNLIAFNRGSGMVLWDCRGVGTSVNHNTIAYNNNNGLLAGGRCDLTMANNIVAFNSRCAVRCAGTAAHVSYVNNDIYGNLALTAEQPSHSAAYDPVFNGPHRGDFTLARSSPCIAKGADGANLGAQILE